MNYAATIHSFGFALAVQAAARADYDHKVAVLQAIPGVGSGAMGLTPDSVKATPEYKKARMSSEIAFQALRAINSVLNSKFKTQYAAHIRVIRESTLKEAA